MDEPWVGTRQGAESLSFLGLVSMINRKSDEIGDVLEKESSNYEFYCVCKIVCHASGMVMELKEIAGRACLLGAKSSRR